VSWRGLAAADRLHVCFICVLCGSRPCRACQLRVVRVRWWCVGVRAWGGSVPATPDLTPADRMCASDAGWHRRGERGVGVELT